MAVQGYRCAAVRGGLPRGELRDREFPEGRQGRGTQPAARPLTATPDAARSPARPVRTGHCGEGLPRRPETRRVIGRPTECLRPGRQDNYLEVTMTGKI